MGLLTATQTDIVEIARAYQAAPPPGQAHSIQVPGSVKEGRSAVYRHWRFPDQVLQTLDPEVKTAHDFFEKTARTLPTSNFLGHRPYDPATKKYGDYVWQDYQTVARRRANLGKGLVELHREAGVVGTQHGIGLWCQNRPEWQITGE
jgi:long-chain acyl-CoA synthetase